MFTSKDQLANYMIAGHLHLSKKDYGFFNNIKITVHDKKPVTSNQDQLFNKLLSKYQRQLHKLNHNVKELVDLPWKVGVVESKQEYLDAHISIQNNTITIRSPFNNRFIQTFRKVHLNKFQWNKVKRVYEAPYSTYQLKIANKAVNDCYESVTYCEQVKEILNQIDEYKVIKHWVPTLVKTQNNFYISAINNSLHEAIKDIELNDDPKTFYVLSQYGVEIDDALLETKFDKFASNYLPEIDSVDIAELAKWLHLLKVECVFTSRDVVYNKELSNDLKFELQKYGIACKPAKDNKDDRGVLLKTHSSWSSFTNYSFYYKIIQFTNSRPVKII